LKRYLCAKEQGIDKVVRSPSNLSTEVALVEVDCLTQITDRNRKMKNGTHGSPSFVVCSHFASSSLKFGARTWGSNVVPSLPLLAENCRVWSFLAGALHQKPLKLSSFWPQEGFEHSPITSTKEFSVYTGRAGWFDWPTPLNNEAGDKTDRSFEYAGAVLHDVLDTEGNVVQLRCWQNSLI